MKVQPLKLVQNRPHEPLHFAWLSDTKSFHFRVLGMQELYIEVSKDVYKPRTTKDWEDLTKLKEDLTRESARLIKARDLLLNEEIDSADYKSIKSAGEKKIADLENKLFPAVG